MPTKDEITTFSLAVESVAKKKNIPYMDAVIEYCTDINLEVEVAAKLVSGALKAKIRLEAEELHFMPRSTSNTLPI